MEPPGPGCEKCYEADSMPPARNKVWIEQFDVDNEEEIIQAVALYLECLLLKGFSLRIHDRPLSQVTSPALILMLVSIN